MQTPYSLIGDIILRMNDYPLVAIPEWSREIFRMGGFPETIINYADADNSEYLSAAPLVIDDPLVVLHLHGLHGTYDLYLTGLYERILLASGYERSAHSAVSDGPKLFWLYWLDDVPMEWMLFLKPGLSIDESFHPMRASELFNLE